MGVVIVKQPTATVDMDVEVPEVGNLQYEVTWDLLGVDEFEKLNTSQQDIADVLVDHFKGLRGPTNLPEEVQGDDVSDVDESALRDILNINYYRKALVMSFIATQQGRAQFAAKN